MEKDIERLLRGGSFLELINQKETGIRQKYDLKKIDVKILYYLSIDPEHNTASDITAYFNMNKGYLSQAVDTLLQRGFLTSVTDGQDRRYVHYQITDKTREIANELRSMWETISEQLFRGVTAEERRTFHRVAAKIQENMRNMK